MASSLRRVHLPSPSLRTCRARPSLRVPTVPAQRGLATPSGAQVRRAFGRLPGVFTALLAVGVCTTGFGLYEYYASFATWPEPLRADLRAGIKAKQQGDLALSVRFLRRAYETAQTLPADAYGAEPHLKLSGLAVSYAGVLEALGRPREAYEVYLDALQRIRHAHHPDAPHFLPAPPPTHRERMRAVALASRLGALAEENGLPHKEEEAFLTYAVEEMLRVVRELDGAPSLAQRLFGAPEKSTDEALVLAGLDLPGWVGTADVGAPLEDLGNFYARTGRYDYAMPLFLQATSLLIPPPPKTAPAEDRCRGAQIMLSLADVLVKTGAPEGMHHARAWAQKSLDVTTKARGAGADEPPRATPALGADGAPHLCEAALVAALFSLGSLAEMEGKPEDAKALYVRSAAQAARARMHEHATEAKTAARRIERAQRVEGASKPDA